MTMTNFDTRPFKAHFAVFVDVLVLQRFWTGWIGRVDFDKTVLALSFSGFVAKTDGELQIKICARMTFEFRKLQAWLVVDIRHHFANVSTLAASQQCFLEDHSSADIMFFVLEWISR